MKSYCDLLPEESLREPSVYCKALAESSTVQIWFPGVYDPKILRSIRPEKMAANSEGEDKAHNPISVERKIRNLALMNSLVTRPRAKAYGFNFLKWSRMMQAASTVDYDKLAKMGSQLKSKLLSAQAVKITSPNGTNLSLDVTGKKWKVSDGVIDQDDIQDENFIDSIPTGSISVIPNKTGVAGKITYNTKLPFMGIKLGGSTVEFKDGKVVSFTGGSTAKKLTDIYEKSKDEKDVIGVFKIGFNPKAEIGYTLDDIVSGTVTVGFGGNSLYGGSNKSGFYHEQAIVGANVEVDGRQIVRSGRLLI
jgi:aminopeptidase